MDGAEGVWFFILKLMSKGGGGSDWRYSFSLFDETHTTTTRNKFS